MSKTEFFLALCYLAALFLNKPPLPLCAQAEGAFPAKPGPLLCLATRLFNIKLAKYLAAGAEQGGEGKDK